MGFDAVAMVERLVQKSYEMQTRNADDYIGDDGLLHCGVCWQPKEAYVTYNLPSGPKTLKVPTECACAYAKRAEKERALAVREKEQELADLRRRSYMDSKYELARFETSDVKDKPFLMCKQYADKFDQMLQGNHGLLLWGDVGTGKTYAAACIANQLLDQGIPVIMTSFVDLFRMMSSDPDAENNLINRMQRSRLVIFDDIGAERKTSYALEKVYNLVDIRYKARKPMIFTTNLSREEMIREEDPRLKRIYDRALEVCFPIQFKGNNYRRAAARERFAEVKELLEGGQ